MSKVVLARAASRSLIDLPGPLRDAVLDALGLLEREPEAGHLLRGRLQGLRSLRVGAYRIIYDLRDSATVRVCAVRHRGTAYATDPR